MPVSPMEATHQHGVCVVTQDISSFDSIEEAVSVMEAQVSNRRTKALEKPRPARRQQLPSRPVLQSEIERICEEMNELQIRMIECSEILLHAGDANDTLQERHLVKRAEEYADFRFKALRTVLSTLVPSTISEVQLMHKVAGSLSNFMMECKTTDEDVILLDAFNVAIETGLARITGSPRIDAIFVGRTITRVLRNNPEDRKILSASIAKLETARDGRRAARKPSQEIPV